MTHLHDDALTHHAAGTLLPSEQASIDAHLKACELCQRRFTELQSLVFSQTLPAPISPTPSAPRGAVTRPDGPGARHEVGDHLAMSKGAQLGRYVLLERLGAGGMGEVFAAYDPHLDRKVALKLLRTGTLSASEGRARLLREAQAMARLSHPNVVTVHDVGTFDDRVFIAMEFIDGETLSTWLRGERKWSEVLRVMLGAGSGLSAAHRAGIVHRDFKPDNVLIGADARARVLDFGLARQAASSKEPTPPRTQSPGPDAISDGSLSTPITRDGAVMGTPGYMAPEQLAGLPTDARSDQFSFCVALYEGLYGKRPFGGATLKAHANEIVAGKLPAPPSGNDVPSYLYEALKRGLSADPAARFPSMEALLTALRPARPTSRRRLLATIALLAVVSATAVAFGLYSNQKLRVCGGADHRLVGVWDAAAKARLKNAFLATRAPFAAAAWRSVESALDTYTQGWVAASQDACEAAQIRKSDSDDLYQRKVVCLETRLQQLKATTALLETADRDLVTNSVTFVQRLDRTEDCRDALALMARSHLHPPKEREQEEALKTVLIDAKALHDAGKYARGVEVAKQALLGGGPPHALAEGYLLLGRLQTRAGDSKGAQASFLTAAVQAEQSGDASLSARAFSALSEVVGDLLQRFDEAHVWGQLAQAAAIRLGADNEVEAELASNEGKVALAEGNYDDALKSFDQALMIQEKALGPEHPEVAMTLNNQATALAKLQRFDEAAHAYERALALHIKSQGAEHPNTASSQHALATICVRQGRLAEALTLFESSLQIREATLGPDHPQVADSNKELGNLLLRLGKPAEALEHLQRALTIRQKAFGEDSVEAGRVHDDIADVFLEQKAWKEALAHAQRSLEIDQQRLGPSAPATAGAHESVGRTLARMGQWDKATAELNSALNIRLEKYGPDHRDVARSYNALADLAMAQGKTDKALALYEKGLAIREKSQGVTNLALGADLVGIGRCQLLLKAPARAVAALERAVALREKADATPELALTRLELARALWEDSTDSHQRAVDLATQARDALSDEPRADAEKWLAAHQLPH